VNLHGPAASGHQAEEVVVYVHMVDPSTRLKASRLLCRIPGRRREWLNLSGAWRLSGRGSRARSTFAFA